MNDFPASHVTAYLRVKAIMKGTQPISGI